MPRLRILERDSVRIKRLPTDHRQAVVASQIQHLLVQLRRVLHCDPSLARRDLHPQPLLNILVDRRLRDLLRQVWHHRCAEYVDIQNQRLSI